MPENVDTEQNMSAAGGASATGDLKKEGEKPKDKPGGTKNQALAKAIEESLDAVLKKTLELALIDLIRPAAKTAMLLAAQDVLTALIKAQPPVPGTKDPGGPGSGGQAGSTPESEGKDPGGGGSGNHGSRGPINIIQG